MFVIANEIEQTKTIHDNEHILKIVNSNQIFQAQNPAPMHATFYQTRHRDIKKIIQEKKQALLEEREKKNKIRDEIFQPVYCRKFNGKFIFHIQF